MEQPRKSADAPPHLLFFLALLVGLTIVLVGGLMDYFRGRPELLAPGIVVTFIVIVTWMIAAGIWQWKASAEAERANGLRSLDARLQHLTELMGTMGQQQLLSDRAKSVAYRSKDRQALRDAIREEMNAKDWDAALVLANDMEREFGYAQESAVLRAEINNSRADVIRQQVGVVINAVDQHVMAEQWTQAVREAERGLQLFPNEHAVQQLPALIEQRRQQHKKSLRDSMESAARRHDFDGALEILRRLDPYLTPAEATGMQEMVRGLLKDRLNGIRDQITKAIHDNNREEVARLGEIVRTEHPNSRLAIEVPDLLERLRQRDAERGQLQPQSA